MLSNRTYFTLPFCLQELSLGCVVQNSGSNIAPDTSDWNHLLIDTSGPNGGRNYRSAPAHGDALVSLAGALRQGFKTLERLDLRGCFMGVRGCQRSFCG